MLPLRLGKSEQDLGVCLQILCPHCQKESDFRLRLRSAALQLFGHAVADFGGSYELMCGSCKFRKDLGDAELSAAQAAVRLHTQFVAHELTSEEYATALDALDFPTIRTLKDEAAMWSCPVCKERAPATLTACWKCNSPRPGMVKSDSPGSDDSARLPYAVTRPSNPWEQ
jgi:hypothetical protein